MKFIYPFRGGGELMIAQVVNLPRVRSAVPSVDTPSQAVPQYGCFSFNEETSVELWGASLFKELWGTSLLIARPRQNFRLPVDHESSTYFIIVNFSSQVAPS